MGLRHSAWGRDTLHGAEMHSDAMHGAETHCMGVRHTAWGQDMWNLEKAKALQWLVADL